MELRRVNDDAAERVEGDVSVHRIVHHKAICKRHDDVTTERDQRTNDERTAISDTELY